MNFKEEQLKARIAEYGREDVAVAFSGGVDSALLLHLCCQAAAGSGKKVYAVTVQTKMHPVREIEKAKEQAVEEGALYYGILMDELSEAGIADNPENRCYLCKKSIFLKIKELAEKLHVSVVLEGTNADDLNCYRPGIQALKELDVRSPLADCGMTKAEIRRMAKALSVVSADKPSTPCLATRLPYGTPITYELLDRIERGEQYLRGLGFYNVRLRVHGEIARIEIDKNDFQGMMDKKEEVTQFLKRLGFVYITLDMEGFRSGSMDVNRKSESHDNEKERGYYENGYSDCTGSADASHHRDSGIAWHCGG